MTAEYSHPTATSQAFKDILFRFSEADRRKNFSFSSGHVGAVPIDDSHIARLAYRGGIAAVFILTGLIFFEAVKFLAGLVFPIRNGCVVARSVLRKMHAKANQRLRGMTVLSLGGQNVDADPYFGPLLRVIDEPFNYIKIVPGFAFRNAGGSFIEASMSYRTLVWFFLTLPFSPLGSLFYLSVGAGRVPAFRQRLIFILLGLKEINAGVVFGQKIISRALIAHFENTQVRKLLFPMEGRNWEKSLLRSVDRKRIHSVGYIHCALTPRHVSLTCPGFIRPDELPTVMVAPSEMAWKLVQGNFPEKVVRKGYFLRGGGKISVSPRKDDRSLLFALTGNVEESKFIMNHVAALAATKRYCVIVRLNPNTSTYKRLSRFATLLGLELYSKQKDSSPALCFFRSSSVAIDYLKLGVVPVYLRLDEVVSNNIFYLDNKYRFDSVDVDGNFIARVESLVEQYRRENDLNGVEIANYYLDQNYTDSELRTLLN